MRRSRIFAHPSRLRAYGIICRVYTYTRAHARPPVLSRAHCGHTHTHTHRIESRSLRSLLRPAAATGPPLVRHRGHSHYALPPPRAGPVTFTCFSRFVVPSVSVCLCVWYPILRPRITWLCREVSYMCSSNAFDVL